MEKPPTQGGFFVCRTVRLDGYFTSGVSSRFAHSRMEPS